jgi:hypothetical protein
MLKITLANLQCSDVETNSSQLTDNATLFGVNGSNYSMLVSMAQNAYGPNYVPMHQTAGVWSETGTYYYLLAANISNYGSTSSDAPEQIDAILLYFNSANNYLGSNNNNPPSSYDPHAASEILIIRLRGSPTTNTFELSVASNSVDLAGYPSAQGGAQSNPAFLGAGFRLISNGNLIYADGSVYIGACDYATKTCSDSSLQGNAVTRNLLDYPSLLQGDVAVSPQPGGLGSGTIAATHTVYTGVYQPFNACIDASGSSLALADLSQSAIAAQCATLANSFDLSTDSAPLSFAQVTGQSGATVGNACDPYTHQGDTYGGSYYLDPTGSSINACIPAPFDSPNFLWPGNTLSAGLYSGSFGTVSPTSSVVSAITNAMATSGIGVQALDAGK